MANTFTLISTITVGSGGASSIDFTSIPSTYTDLLIKVSARGTSSANFDSINIKLNGASTTGWTDKELYTNNGTSASSYTRSNGDFAGVSSGGTSTSNTFSNVEIYIPNYAGSQTKIWSADGVAENNATAGYLVLVAGTSNITAAISSITLQDNTGANNFVQYSTASLYGILKA